MDNAKINNILENLSFNVLDFNEGDLMLYGEILDSLEELETLLRKRSGERKLVSALKDITKTAMATDLNHDLQQILSESIDVLTKARRYVESTGKTSVSDEIADGLKRLTGEITSIVSTTKKTGKTKGNKKEPAAPKRKKQKSKSGSKPPGAVAAPKPQPADGTRAAGENVSGQYNHWGIETEGEAYKIFLVEADEKLIEAQDVVLQLEKDPENADLVGSLFRIFHTIKGECGFLKITVLGELSHHLENLLDMYRSDAITPEAEGIDLLLKGIDNANRILSILKGRDTAKLDTYSIEHLLEQLKSKLQHIQESIGQILRNEGKITEEQLFEILDYQREIVFTKKFGEIAIERGILTQEDLKSCLKKQKIQEHKAAAEGMKADPVIKVKASQINFVVDMVGELLIAENQLDDSDKLVVQLKKITRELQNAAMQLRTTKVKNLFLKMKRVVRDLSQTLGRKINMNIEGLELEIDRDLVESLEEPLIHLLRNACDHGIESAEKRAEQGKPEEGSVTLAAERRGNSIVVSIEDDGAGLDRDAIIKKAVATELVSSKEAEGFSDNEAYALIFKPGFSTAGNVDQVSGRGVGMDIVRSTVQTHRGRIEIQTRLGKFSRFSLVFPLSTAIIDGMIVRTHQSHFIVPVSNVIESVKVEDGMISRVKGQVEVLNLREVIIPVISTHQYFFDDKVSWNKNKRKLAIIVQNSIKKQFALLVDEIIAKKEIVIKSLGSKFNTLEGISSGTVLQGGHVGFVLDVDQLVTTNERRNDY